MLNPKMKTLEDAVPTKFGRRENPFIRIAT
jgi:hypothetical protein